MITRNEDGLTEQEFLAQYKTGNYEKPSVTADVVLFKKGSNNKLQLLLIKRKNHPYIGHWALPGGFVDINESAYDAAKRELEEETGLANVDMEQLCTMSDPNRDPRMRVISIAHMAVIEDQNLKPAAGDDASEALWFDMLWCENALVLKNEEESIRIEYDLSMGTPIPVLDSRLNSYITQSNLAFDHAEIVFAGLQRIKEKNS